MMNQSLVRRSMALVALLGLWLLSGASRPACADIGQPLNTTQFKSTMEIAFSGYAGTTTLADLPVLLVFNSSIVDFDYGQFKDGAADLRFTDAGNLELAYEIEEWNTAGSSYVWVRLTQLQNNTDVIRAFWGSAALAAPAYPAGSVWNSGYRGVWHMGQTSPTDATTNANHGVGVNTATAAGGVSGALEFGGTAYVNINAVNNDITSADMSLSAMIRTSSTGGTTGGSILSFTSSRTTLGELRLMLNVGPETVDAPGPGEAALFATPPAGFNNLAVDTNTRVDNGVWRHVAYVRNGATGRVYVDGVERGSHAASFIYASTDRWSIGQTWLGSNRSRYFTGLIDEVRVSNVPRSADWIAASAKMVLQNGSFLTYRAVETTPELGTILFGF